MLTRAKNGIEKAVKHLEVEFSKLQLGRANPALIEDIYVESYGNLQPIKNVASVSLLDPQTLNIKPWDKSVLHAIARAITDAAIGLNPQSMGDGVIIKVPPLTEERRIDIAKIAKRLSDEAKVSVRNARGDSHKDISNAKEEKSISEDEAKDFDIDLQKLVDDGNKKIDELYKKKEVDIMKL